MKILVAYKGTPQSEAALGLAIDHARRVGGSLYVINSQEGGTAEKAEKVAKVHQKLRQVEKRLKETGLAFEVHETVRGLSPGEDIVWFAERNGIEHIFVGVEKKSKTQKIILGSNAQYIILKAPCPVTTTK